MKCLLIETKDKRKFFTHEKNYIQLIEFSKIFNAEISTVKLHEGTVLDLEELAPAICDSTYKKTEINYEIISKTKNRTRNDMLKIAETIKNYIFDRFKNNNTVSLKDLKNKFKKYNLTNATLCNHIRRAKEALENQGFKFKKITTGEYTCTI